MNLELWLSSRKDIVHFVDEQKWVIFSNLKFRYSEKATKIWPSLLFLTSLSSNGIIEEVRKNSKVILFLPSEFFKNSSLQQIFQRQDFQALFILILLNTQRLIQSFVQKKPQTPSLFWFWRKWNMYSSLLGIFQFLVD